MHIGIYDPYLDDLGGGEKYMMSIAQVLSQKHEVDVFWDNQKDIDMLLERFQIDLSKVNRVQNIFSPQFSFIKKLFATQKYDAIIFLSDGSIPLSLSKKLFLHIQQPLPGVTTNPFIKWKLSRVTDIFCNSVFSKSFVDEQIGIQAKVIYPPVPIDAKKMKKENMILHVGRFRVANIGTPDYKKHSVMVEVFKQMVDNGLKNWKFVIASGVREQDKEEFEALQKKAKGYPIHFEVNRTNEALWDIYSKAKIYWHASGYGENLTKHPEYAEHFGISTVEAMGAGAVPVVINAGGQKEIVTNGENGFLWDSLDELQEKTQELMDKPKMVQKLSENAKERSKDFSYEKFTEAVNNLIA